MKHFPAVLLSILLTFATLPLHASWESGVSAFKAGRYDEAAAVFEELVLSSPDAPQGHYMLGMSLLQQKRLDAAIKALGKAHELGPDDANTTLALAQAQLKASQADRALKTLAAADPAAVPKAARPNFEQLLAKAATASGLTGEADRALDRALATSPKSKPLWVAKATVAQRDGRSAERFTALAEVFEIDPKDASAGAGAVRAGIHLAQDTADPARKAERYRRAASLSRRLAAGSPTGEHLMLAGSAEMGAQDYEAALTSFEKARAAGSDDLLLDYYLGRSKLALDRDQEALEHLQATLDRSTDAELTRSVHAARGLAYRKLERFDEAAAALRQAGDTSQAEEMERYAKNRREWEIAKAECVEKRQKIADLKAGSEELKGTPEWAELEQEFAAVLAACESYFVEQS